MAFRDAKHGVIVGGDYTKEKEAVDNLAVTGDGGLTWKRVEGLSGFRSAVAYVSSFKTTLIAVGPSGADYSTDDGHSWARLNNPEGRGFDTLSLVRGRPFGWGAGAQGNIARLMFE